ncbi:MAG: stage III sporulation protein D [Clostridiales bacterium]|nr:stage III sporulation protein D [Clostridiales bacterium]
MNDTQILQLANFILDNKLTIRKTAKIYNIPKSTLHYYVAKKLIEINYNLYLKLHRYLQQNFKEKHIRGGMATKNKYKNNKKLKP